MVLNGLLDHQKGKTFVFLVRHGHFDHQEDIPHQRNPHHPLSKKGVRQAKHMAKQFASLKDYIDVFYTSSMKRAEQTAYEIAKVIDKTPELSEQLWEFNKIRWTRKYYKYDFWKNWMRHKLRMRAFDKILTENAGKVILIVGHGNLIKGIVQNKLNLPLKEVRSQQYSNCHISLLRFNNTNLEFVHSFNSKHLDALRS